MNKSNKRLKVFLENDMCTTYKKLERAKYCFENKYLHLPS